MAGLSSKEAHAHLIDPLIAPDPASETGPGSHFGSTFAPAKPQLSEAPDTQQPPPPSYSEIPPLQGANAGPSTGHRRRASSLKERFPGDDSNRPLDVIRDSSKRADRAPHLNKRHIPGADLIDRLDPTLGGQARAYHHEGPYDAALLARNNFADSPIAALKESNAEAIKATPVENVRDAVEGHKPLDGVAAVPSGDVDRFGRRYEYEEGADLAAEAGSDGPGYERSPDHSEPPFPLDHALQTHRIDDEGIEMEDRAHGHHGHHQAHHAGKLGKRDSAEIAGGQGREDMESGNTHDNDAGTPARKEGGLRSLGGSLKKRLGRLGHKNEE